MNRWRVVEVIDDDDYWLFRASSGPTLSFDSFDSHVANIGVENIAEIYRCVQYNFKCLESWCQVAVWRLNVKHVKTFKDARWVMPVFQYIYIYNICCSNVIFPQSWPRIVCIGLLLILVVISLALIAWLFARCFSWYFSDHMVETDNSGVLRFVEVANYKITFSLTEVMGSGTRSRSGGANQSGLATVTHCTEQLQL